MGLSILVLNGQIPVSTIDSWAYGRSTFPTLNILHYNLFGSGPELYGTSDATFYVANLLLNFNILLVPAMLAFPALLITYRYDTRRLGKTQRATQPGETSPYILLTLRLLPFHIWLGILTHQAHKEERFMFPAYPLLCFNAAVGIFLVRGWIEAAFIAYTKSPWKASQTRIFSHLTLLAVVVPGILSFGRILALANFYHAPLDMAHQFQYVTLPGVLADLGHSPIKPPASYKPKPGRVVEPQWDYSPLLDLHPPIRLCYGAEWYRFPSSYLFVEGVDIQFIQTEFDGMMPRRWSPSGPVGVWPRNETRVTRLGRFNGENKASDEPGTYVDPTSCHYLVALSSPSTGHTKLEPDWANRPEWIKEFCVPFLDAHASAWWSKLVWLPGGLLDHGRVYGDYCLLRRR